MIPLQRQGARFYVGLDLGQRRDHSALAVVEKMERYQPYGPHEFEGLQVRHVERMPLGMTYPQVVRRVQELVEWEGLAGQCELVVDATGVGAPVVDMLRAARLGCEMWAVTITGGEKESVRRVPGGAQVNVPKRDLFAAVQVLLERDELKIAGDLPERESLTEELVDVQKTQGAGGYERMGAEGAGQHDDLAMALALACWKGRRVERFNNFGVGRIV